MSEPWVGSRVIPKPVAAGDEQGAVPPHLADCARRDSLPRSPARTRPPSRAETLRLLMRSRDASDLAAAIQGLAERHDRAKVAEMLGDIMGGSTLEEAHRSAGIYRKAAYRIMDSVLATLQKSA
jgi:hypothetical protein